MTRHDRRKGCSAFGLVPHRPEDEEPAADPEPRPRTVPDRLGEVHEHHGGAGGREAVCEEGRKGEIDKALGKVC